MRRFQVHPTITERDEAALDSYLREISGIPLLSSEEEAELSCRIQQGDEAALEKLVNSNQRFVVSVANRYKGHSLTLSDLINEGNLGLIAAARRFDPSRGFRFLSYAVWWIRQAIMLAILSQGRLVRVPENMQELQLRITRYCNTFQQTQERMPSADEIAEALDVEASIVELALQTTEPTISMDAPIDEEKGASLLDFMHSDAANAEQQLANEDFRAEVTQAVNNLPPREREIIRMYFGLDGPELSLEDIGEHIGLGRERTRLLKEKAIANLRKAQFGQMVAKGDK